VSDLFKINSSAKSSSHPLTFLASWLPYLLISPSPHLPIDIFFPSVSRHFPDEALSSEFAVEFRIHTFTAIVDIQALAACLTEPCLMFLAGSNGLLVRMISTLHHFSFLLGFSAANPPFLHPLRNGTLPEQNISRPCSPITFPCA